MKRQFSLASLFLGSLLTIGPLAAQDLAEYETAVLTVVNDTIVASEAPGIIKRILVSPGHDVARDELLIGLSRDEYEANLKVAELTARIAEMEATNDVNIRFAQKSYQVNDRLLRRSRQARIAYTKSVSDTDIDRLKLELEQSKLSEEQAIMQTDVAKSQLALEKANIEVARLRLENRDIKAPFAGRLEQLYVQPGQWVQAGQEIARVVDLGHLRAKGIFNADLIQRISVGNKATFEYSIGDETFLREGTVSFVNSVIVKGNFQVWIDIDNANQELVPGFEGKMTVELN